MAWIKRNLFLVLSAAVGLILMAGAGYYFYSNWDADRTAIEELNQAKSELQTLQGKKPVPTKEIIQAVKDSQKDARAMLAEFKKVFAAPPEMPTMDEKTFKVTLDRTLSQLQASATNFGVTLMQPDYAFSFGAQTTKLNFPSNSIAPWLVQLEEIKGICGVVYNAKVNTFEGIRRVPVSSDEAALGSSDFLSLTVVSNEIVRVPYEIVVRAYSRELADMINGFLRSTNCYIIKVIDIGPSTGSTAVTQAPTGGGIVDPYANMRRRRPAATVANDTTPNPSAPVTMVSEGLMRVVILLEIVKPKAS